MIDKIRKVIKENRIPKEAYQKFASDIAHYNLNALRQISFVGMVGGIILVIACLPPIHLLSLLKGYFSIAVLFTIVFALTCTVLKKHEAAVTPVYYAFITLVLAISVLMGTWWGTTTNATTFVMLILMFPMLIIDRPHRIHILTGAFCVIFCLADLNAKSGKLLDLDIANCIVFYLLSMIISSQTIRAKMSDIIVKHELKEQRDMDMLTKLSNRGAFERVVAKYIHESNQNAVLMIMDIDKFKSVNDIMGHAYGDMVLQLVGEYLQAAFRSGDTVSRLGGDEFVAFLPAASNTDVITEKVQQLIERISAIEIKSEKPCKIGASAGLAQYPSNGCSFEELYKMADKALYDAKQSGKGKCVWYSDAENEKQPKA